LLPLFVAAFATKLPIPKLLDQQEKNRSIAKCLCSLVPDKLQMKKRVCPYRTCEAISAIHMRIGQALPGAGLKVVMDERGRRWRQKLGLCKMQ